MPKIKFLLWRMLSGALAVGECLQRHGIQVNQTCKICASGAESIQHVLFECTLATQVWSNLSHMIQLLPGSLSIESYADQILTLVENKGHQNKYCRALPWLLCLIWKRRNGKVFADKPQNADTLIAQGIEEAEEWFKLNALKQAGESSVPRQSQQVDNWTAPRQDKLKCNLNVASGGTNKLSGMAWLLRDYAGTVIFHARDVVLQSQSKIFAEFQALLCTVQSLVNLRIGRVEIWVENFSIVKAIHSPKDWPKFRNLLNQWREMSMPLTHCVIKHYLWSKFGSKINRQKRNQGRSSSVLPRFRRTVIV